MFPMVLSSLSSGLVAVNRISTFLTAEELAEPYLIDRSLKAAVTVDGDFMWETAGNLDGPNVVSSDKQGKEAEPASDAGERKKAEEEISTKAKAVLPINAAEGLESPPGKELEDDDRPFELKNLKISIPKGSFVAIVGRVGSGKVILVIIHNLPDLRHLSEFSPSVSDWRDASDERRGEFLGSSRLFIEIEQVIR